MSMGIAAAAAGAAGLILGFLFGLPVGWWSRGQSDALERDAYDPHAEPFQ